MDYVLRQFNPLFAIYLVSSVYNRCSKDSLHAFPVTNAPSVLSLISLPWCYLVADPSGRPVLGVGLPSLARIPPRAWIFVCCECCVLSGRGLCNELITRPEESYRLCCVVVCDLETSRMGAPYIYDISHLRVNNLTLILLTWRKLWAPNNANK